MTETKGKNLFWKSFALILCFLVIVVLILLNLGYKVMMDYDETQSFPQKKASEIAENIKQGNYDLIFMDEKTNPYLFQKEEYYQYIGKLIEENGCFASRGFSSDRYNHPVYDIKAGDITLAKVEFSRNEEKSEYGFDSYYYEKTTPVKHGSHAIKVLVPENATLEIFGQTVSEKYKTGKTETISSEKTTFWTNDEGNARESLIYEYYYIDDLLTEPTPVIHYNDTGKAAVLCYSGDFGAFTTDSFYITITAPSNYKVYVNDKLISSEERFVTRNNVEIEEIDKVASKYVSTLVTMVTYRVTDLRDDSDITVKVFDFFGTEVSKTEESTATHLKYDCGITPESLESYAYSDRKLIDIAEGYSRFVNDDGDRKETILPYVYEKSQAYEDFSDFWVVFSAHLEYWFENEMLEQVVFYQEDLFFADVSFDYWIKGFDHKTDNTKCYPTFVRFWYAKINGEWKIVEYSLNR